MKVEHEKIVKLLLKKGADPNCCDQNQSTALHFLCSKMLSEYELIVSFNIAKLLIKHGADINATNWRDETLLYLACKIGWLDFVRLLIKKGALIDHITFYGRTPLYAACRHAHLEIAKLLIENKAQLNIIDKHGNTLAHAVCKSLAFMLNPPTDIHYTLITILMEHKVTFDKKSITGRLPINLVSSSAYGAVDNHIKQKEDEICKEAEKRLEVILTRTNKYCSQFKIQDLLLLQRT